MFEINYCVCNKIGEMMLMNWTCICNDPNGYIGNGAIHCCVAVVECKFFKGVLEGLALLGIH